MERKEQSRPPHKVEIIGQKAEGLTQYPGPFMRKI